MSNYVPTNHDLRIQLILCYHLKKTAAESHRMLVEAYGEHALGETQCKVWFRKFRSGDFDVRNEKRGRPPKKFEDAELKALLDGDPSQTQGELAKTLGVTQPAISNRLKAMRMIRKVNLWVRYELKPRIEKKPRIHLRAMITLKQTNKLFRKSCAIGLLLSIYALFVEIKREVNEDYVALCDINEYISCSKAFSSKYGKGFGVIGTIFGEDSLINQPNSVAGIIFYTLLLILNLSEKRNVLKLQLCFCIVTNFVSVYLAYILYFILHDFCVVCVGTYIINAINLALCILKWNLTNTSCITHINSKQKSKRD